MSRFIRVEDDENDPKLVMISDRRAIHTGNGRTYRVEEEPDAKEFGGGLILGVILAGVAVLLFSSFQSPASNNPPATIQSPVTTPTNLSN